MPPPEVRFQSKVSASVPSDLYVSIGKEQKNTCTTKRFFTHCEAPFFFLVQVIHVLIDDQCLFPEKLLEKPFFLRDFLCLSHLKRSSFLHDLLKTTIVLQQQTV